MITWIPWIFNQTALAVDFAKRIVLAAYTEAVVEKKWLLLHSVQVPVSSTVFPDASDTIRWRVTLNPTRFMDSSEMKDIKHISYLGLSIISEGKTIDLTDWVNDVQWSGRVEPTISELFAIWCCEMGKPYFHLITNAEVECINEQGDCIRTSLV